MSLGAAVNLTAQLIVVPEEIAVFRLLSIRRARGLLRFQKKD
jgi:hypothetical protein